MIERFIAAVVHHFVCVQQSGAAGALGRANPAANSSDASAPGVSANTQTANTHHIALTDGVDVQRERTLNSSLPNLIALCGAWVSKRTEAFTLIALK